MKTRSFVLGIALVAVAAAQPLSAISTTGNLTVNATVTATASLTLGAASIGFPDANPDVTSSIPASAALTVTAKGKTSRGSLIALTVQAGGDLVAGLDSIAISNVTWTSGSSGFVAGTMNSATAQAVGSWTNSGNRNGSLNFFLANSWDYATGSYTASATFTLTAP